MLRAINDRLHVIDIHFELLFADIAIIMSGKSIFISRIKMNIALLLLIMFYLDSLRFSIIKK